MVKIGLMIIKLEGGETEISCFLSKEKSFSVFKSSREGGESKGLTAV